MRVGKKLKPAHLLLTTAIIAFAPSIQAQENNRTGLEVGLSQTLRYTDNVDFTATAQDAFLSVTDLSFAYRSFTRSERFEFVTGGGLEFGSGDDSANGLNDPFLTLNYATESRDTVLTAGLRYQLIDTNTSFVQTFAGMEFLFLDSGTREDIAADVGLIFGRTQPFGGEIEVAFASQDYRDTTDPDLVDTDRTQVSGRLNFILSPTVTTFATGSYRLTERDGADDKETTSFGLGADVAVNPRLTATGSISFDRTENLDTGSVTDGVGISLDMSQDMPNGSLSASLSSRVTESGRRSTVSATRSLELPGGSLSFTAGASESDDTSLEPLVGLQYARALTDRSAISVGIEQAFDTNSDGEERLNTLVDVGYDLELSRVSSLNADFSWRDSNVLNASGDASRVDARLTYRQQLAREWDLVSGYSFSEAKSDTASTRTSNTVFVGIEKTFVGGF